MWDYCLNDKKIEECISNRIKFPNVERVATEMISSLGYDQEEMKLVSFEDMIFTEGSLDEVYTQAEIKICEEMGNIFVSTGKDIFNFFLMDIPESEQFDAVKIGSIIKIINKAFNGENIIIFQCQNQFLFGSRYVSTKKARDFHFTYWISKTDVLKSFASYNICKNNKKYSYAMYMAYVCQWSLFKHKWWSDIKEEAEDLKINFVDLSKKLAHISSRQVDSFEMLEKAILASEFIKNDSQLQSYRDDYEDEEYELYNDTSVLLEYLKE